MKYTLPVFLSAMCVACGTVKQAAPSEKHTVETRIETVFVTDTVLVELPKIVERVETLDTVSVLDNEFAHSTAKVSDGVLSHSLETKPVKKPVEVKKEIVYRDSIVFKDRIVVETVEVETELSGWEKFKMKTGGFAIGLLIIAIVCIVLYIVKPLNLIKL